ncbi:hypothetical protein EFK50_11815 [Nocardioides marmoriginsengisoli]|uniref:Uncharacterized protein n=1 Tax=Nocardioides marmoriginsengisoli TaxID=661483 RepID=A0A3N0CG52_9ACTN|nr:hypothetical protein [Nocardioides marmoriginsengisoli]RNL62452.1 hypothetical protein EFK50_11815 [Nocardioides marmoriginsengisoli]
MRTTMTIAADDLQSHFYDQGWTDGLPIVAPTAAAVEAMLAGGGVAADEVLGAIPAHGVTMDAEHAATAAVMAGCVPEYFPIVLAAVGATLDPLFNLQVACTSTGGPALCTIVSGPLAAELAMNAEHNALASGNRANATIGRAVRFAAVNLLRTQVDGTDGSSIGNPGKYTFCFAERPVTGWSSLREDLGYAEEDTTVTVAPTTGPIQVGNHLTAEPDAIAASLAAAMRMPSLFTTGKGGAQFVIALGVEHEAAFRDNGWTRADLRARLREGSRIRVDELRAAGIVIEEGTHHDMSADADGYLRTVAADADIHVVSAGGAGAGWSAVIPSWAPRQHAQIATRRVRVKGEELPDCGPDSCAIDPTAMEGRL